MEKESLGGGGGTCLRTGSGSGSAGSAGADLRLRRLGVRGDILARQCPQGAFPSTFNLKILSSFY